MKLIYWKSLNSATFRYIFLSVYTVFSLILQIFWNVQDNKMPQLVFLDLPWIYMFYGMAISGYESWLHVVHVVHFELILCILHFAPLFVYKNTGCEIQRVNLTIATTMLKTYVLCKSIQNTKLIIKHNNSRDSCFILVNLYNSIMDPKVIIQWQKPLVYIEIHEHRAYWYRINVAGLLPLSKEWLVH